MTVEWARKIIAEKALLIDTETTGGSFEDEIIDLAIIQLPELEVLYSGLIKPTRHINYYAQQVHGITYEMLQHAPYLESEADKINQIVKNQNIVAYNVSFDKRLFHQSYNKYSIEIPDCTWECLMVQCTKLFGKQLKLSKICEILNIEKGTHRAKTDALAAAKVIHKIAENKHGYFC